MDVPSQALLCLFAVLAGFTAKAPSARHHSQFNTRSKMDVSSQALLCLFAVLAGFTAADAHEYSCPNACEVPFHSVGCYHDMANRALPVEILNERDESSDVKGDQLIEWLRWDKYVPEFACRCAKLAKAKGYSYFALQFYGECWSGPTPTGKEYAKYGKSENCASTEIDAHKQAIKKCEKGNRFCSGKQWSNYVYHIEPDCDLKFEKVGCFADNHKVARPLPVYIMTDRDKSRTDISSGHSIDWAHWDTYIPELACRCAHITKAKGWNTFGLQFYGECWSSKDAEKTYAMDGKSSRCVDKCYQPCKDSEKFCAGQHYTNAVYRLIDSRGDERDEKDDKEDIKNDINDVVDNDVEFVRNWLRP
ncbi:predicted protein [Nematostella vectensis]|uniref:Uncharacterized protein n=1 Tax=Nematostella vectensis TaxID=45351 RepID=A7S8B2_NEMVE|nr:predicted protein [Nematostella vectensis]|eukprot:XP_001632096.1 predicted protein [Nematostella vectensis]